MVELITWHPGRSWIWAPRPKKWSMWRWVGISCWMVSGSAPVRFTSSQRSSIEGDLGAGVDQGDGVPQQQVDVDGADVEGDWAADAPEVVGDLTPPLGGLDQVLSCIRRGLCHGQWMIVRPIEFGRG